VTRPTTALGSPFAAFALTALAVAAVWGWLGAPVKLPPSPLTAGQKLGCVSYAPFRDGQDPLVEGTHVEPAQIDADLALVAHYSDCVRTYSIENGLDRVAEIAQRHGLKVLQGLWLSGDAAKNRQQIATTVALAKAFPGTIEAVIVGNEVLLRGDLSVNDLMAIIREVKAQIRQPVSYADVWEFWLRYRDVASAVDFVTIHILPYWEDFPLPARLAAAHVDAIRKKVAEAIPGKEILVGEFGWPRAGRMRESALPSPSNQALALGETLALAQREHFRVNVIEAFDQPWKRWLEGSVGGFWGIFDRATGAPKFSFTGGEVSDHPHWRLQALAGIVLAASVFAGAFVARGGEREPALWWWRIATFAFLPAVLFGWTLEKVPVESFTVGSWLRSLGLASVAAVAPVACAVAYAARQPLPAFASLLAPRERPRDPRTIVLGAAFILLVVLSVQAALNLVFDSRYPDIPFAPLSGAVLSFVVLHFSTNRPKGLRPAAEAVAAAVLSLSAVFIAINETFANWQATWFCATLLALAFILLQARDAPGSE
jgi:glucan 1,3-beta-glucosidase